MIPSLGRGAIAARDRQEKDPARIFFRPPDAEPISTAALPAPAVLEPLFRNGAIPERNEPPRHTHGPPRQLLRVVGSGAAREIPLSRPRWQLVKTAHPVVPPGFQPPRVGPLGGPDKGREQGRGPRGLPARLAAIETGPADPSRPQPGTTNPSKKKKVFWKGSWCRRAAAGRAAGGAARGPMRNTSPDRAPRTSHKLVGPWGAPGPPMSAGSRTRRTRAGAGGRGRGQPGGWRRSTWPSGAPGDRPGAANEPLERTFFSRAACSPPGGPGLKALLKWPCSPTPCDEGKDLLKGGRSRGISGKAADWRCIHAHFPVMNRVIP
jgi:hypothetical protein